MDDAERTIADVAAAIQRRPGCRVVVMCGAGMSTDAGIPDFRSPGGLYASLAQMPQLNLPLPTPEAIFSLDYFRATPEPFMAVFQSIMHTNAQPTVAHYFLKVLADRGLLARVYTQNVDGLERKAGVDPSLVVEAHGSVATAHCANPACRKPYDVALFTEAARAARVLRCDVCSDPIKPGTIFFGEPLPPAFFANATKDLATSDVLLIMGTSLMVQPFASLVNLTPPRTPRLLVNRERVGESDDGGRTGLVFEPGSWDVFAQTSCDAGAAQLAELLGVYPELAKLCEANGRTMPPTASLPRL